MPVNVEWTEQALQQAADALEDSLEFGVKTQRKLYNSFDSITARLKVMPRIGPLDDVYQDEDGEYRFIHANKAIKVCYRVVDDEHVIVFAVLPVKMSPRKHFFQSRCQAP